MESVDPKNFYGGVVMGIKNKLKTILVEELNLEEPTPEEIDDDAPIFGEGLGLDSLDAVVDPESSGCGAIDGTLVAQ